MQHGVGPLKIVGNDHEAESVDVIVERHVTEAPKREKRSRKC